MGRPKLIQDHELLAAAREVFVEKGLAASTREIAKKAGISEAVVYQRYATKSDLFFAAMVPPAFEVEELLTSQSRDCDVQAHLEKIAIQMMGYFRKLMPILLPLTAHPSFNFEEFVGRQPDSPINNLRQGLMAFLNSQAECGALVPRHSKHISELGLTLFAALHSLALFEVLGVHGGKFDDAMVCGVVRSLWVGVAPATPVD